MLECGDVITQDLRLRRSLWCDEDFATPGLRIGADGVDIDLIGHALRVRCRGSSTSHGPTASTAAAATTT